ncbi:MAG: hypothetical protein QXV32_06435 [Conexivisphaerales archaeon]
MVEAEADKKKAISQLFEQRRGIVEQLKKIRTRKAELLEELDQLASKLEDERQQYKMLREKLNSLNDDKKSLVEEIKRAKQRYKEAYNQLEQMRPVLKGNGEELKKELKRIEWKVQTEPLGKEEEKRMLEKMKEMAEMLSVWKKAYELKDQANKLDRELDEKSAALFDIKADRQETIKMMQEKRQKIEEYTKAGRQVYGEVEGLEQDIAELEKRYSEIDSKLNEMRNEIEKSRKEEQAHRLETRLTMNREALEKAKREAMEKFQRGEALSLNDLKLLYDEDNVK